MARFIDSRRSALFNARALRSIPRPQIAFSVSGCRPVVLRNRRQVQAVSIANFGRPEATDYRNPVLASAAKDLGYVQRFGSGIPRAGLALKRNGNPPAAFQAEADFVHVTIWAAP